MILRVRNDPAVKALAEGLHEWEADPAVDGSELNCYTCATWPDKNTPGFQPKPSDHCYESAAAILAALPDWTLVRREELERLRAALDETRSALVTVAQWDSWASEWLAKHPALDAKP